MKTIEALRPQTGEYGTVVPGDTIKATDERAALLVASGNWASPQDAKKLRKERAEKEEQIRAVSAARARRGRGSDVDQKVDG